MSFSEILVALFVAILVLSPEDIKALIKIFYQLKKYLTDLKNQIFAPIQAELDKLEEEDYQNHDEINFYLDKIALLNQKYEGEYSLEKIKQHYYSILKDTIKL